MVWPGLFGKIDGEPGEDSVHRFDSAKSPAAVHAKAARGQLHQRLNVAAFDFSRRRQFLKFFSHNLS